MGALAHGNIRTCANYDAVILANCNVGTLSCGVIATLATCYVWHIDKWPNVHIWTLTTPIHEDASQTLSIRTNDFSKKQLRCSVFGCIPRKILILLAAVFEEARHRTPIPPFIPHVISKLPRSQTVSTFAYGNFRTFPRRQIGKLTRVHIVIIRGHANFRTLSRLYIWLIATWVR